MRSLTEKNLNDKTDYPSNFTIDTREHKGWTYQSAQSTIDGSRVIYCRTKDLNGSVKEQVEYYSGPNYLPGTSGRSYSRCYQMDEVPARYSTTVFLLEQYLVRELKHDIIQKKSA